MKIINPYTQEVISEVSNDSKETIENKFNKAKVAQLLGLKHQLMKD